MVRAKLFPSAFSLRMASRYLWGGGGGRALGCKERGWVQGEGLVAPGPPQPGGTLMLLHLSTMGRQNPPPTLL